VHLSDVVRAIDHALTTTTPASIYNVVAPHAISHRDLAIEVGRFHSVWLKLAVPSVAARLLAGQMAEELLLTGQQVLPRQLEDDGFTFHFATVADALTDLTSR
jgi:NAD dependent epimerase/dehydratase family enzyme